MRVFRSVMQIVTLISLSGCALMRSHDSVQIDPYEQRLQAFHSALDSMVASPLLAPTHVGLAVWSLDRSEWIAEYQADKLFVPASNAKLIPAVAALSAYGPAHRFYTTVFSDTTRRDSTILNNIYLRAGGAPDLTVGDIAGLAERLRSLGVERIDGALVLDATLFDSVSMGPGWMWDEGPYAYNAPVNAFMLEDNTVRLTIRPGESPGDTVYVIISPRGAGERCVVEATTRLGTDEGERLRVWRRDNVLVVTGTMSIERKPVTVWRTVEDPVRYAGSIFIHELRNAGISINDSMVVGKVPVGAAPIAYTGSVSLDVLVRTFLKQTHNLTGETLLKQLGATYRGEGTWMAGLHVTRRIMHDLVGLDSTKYRLADGSGMSRYTELSPRMLVDVLRIASTDFSISSELLAALPIGGLDGTLSRRLTEDDVVGTIRGKTGTMRGVSCLSGILVTQSGERLVYSLLMNGFAGSAWSARYMQDRVVIHLRELPPSPQTRTSRSISP
jgi:serine-type D-Ala-D-Ala carboxypeptidase/endopeptidase (penicillin-binding protein 4)